MLCPVCKFRNPKGSLYCHNCGRTFATFRQSSQWDRYATSEDSGAYRYPTEAKAQEQGSLFDEDPDAMSTTQEIPRWDSIANAPIPAPPGPKQKSAGQQPLSGGMDYDGEQSIEEVSASYDNTFLRRFMSKLSPSETESDLDSLSSTSRLPKWEEEDASISVSRKPSEPPPPAPPRPTPMPQAPAPQPPPPVAAPARELIPVIEQPLPPMTDADLPSVQIADLETGQYPTYPPPPSAAPAGRPHQPSGNRLAVVLICILSVILLLLGASAVLLYLIKTKTGGIGADKILAVQEKVKGPEPAAPAPSKPKAKKTRPPKKETGAQKPAAEAAAKVESGRKPASEKPDTAKEEPSSQPGPAPAKPPPVEVKNLNPLLNDPPEGRLVEGKIFSQGHVIELDSGTFAIERPAKVYAASVFAGKIPSNRALVDVEIALTGSANPKQYKVFIIDARGQKRGPNSSVENYLILPKTKKEIHKLWKKSCWVPEKETHLLHRGFLVPDNAASSFIIEIKGPKSGKVLWFNIAEQSAGE
jgi:hypothetical protein